MVQCSLIAQYTRQSTCTIHGCKVHQQNVVLKEVPANSLMALVLRVGFLCCGSICKTLRGQKVLTWEI